LGDQKKKQGNIKDSENNCSLSHTFASQYSLGRLNPFSCLNAKDNRCSSKNYREQKERIPHANATTARLSRFGDKLLDALPEYLGISGGGKDDTV
jgi:hypothetical protein